MAEPESKLSQADKDKAVKWLEEHLAQQACPACGFNEWVLGDTLILAPTFIKGGMALGAGYPALVVICGRCMFFRMHSAIGMGLVTSDEKPPKEEVKNG